MASRYTPPAYHAIGVFDERFVPDEADTSSSYSESTPRPGVGAPSTTSTYASVRASGAQSVGLTVTTQAPGTWRGMPDGARPSWRLTSEATTQGRGWLTPSAMTGAWPLDAGDYAFADAVVVPSTQAVMILANNQTNLELECWRFDPNSGPIGGAVLILASAPSLGVPAGCVLPVSERLLCIFVDQQADVYYSDDAGATWALYASDVLDTSLGGGTTASRARALVSPTGSIVLSVQYSDGAEKAVQYVSTDYGASFQRVAAGWACVSSDVVMLADGSVGLVDVSGGNLRWRRVASIRDRLDLATTSTVNTVGTILDAGVCVDADGSVYAASLVGSAWRLYRTDDAGASWRAFDHVLRSSGNTRSLGALVWAAGSMIMASGTNTSTPDYPLMAFRWGGWSNIDTNRNGVTASATDLWATAVAPSDSIGDAVAIGWTYCSIVTLPTSEGWTSGGGAPASGYVYQTPADSDARTVLLIASLDVTAGGSTAADEAGIIVRLRNAAANSTRGVAIRCSSTQFAIYDIGAAAIEATITPTSMTNLEILIEIDNSVLRVGYRNAGATAWTQASYSLSTIAGSPAAVVGWGDNGIAGSNFRLLTYCANWTATAANVGAGTRPLASRPISSIPYPLYRLASTATAAAVFLVGGDGPTGYADSWAIATAPDYPISAVDPRVSPSPDVVWRSTDTTEQTIAWIPATSTRWTSSSVALVILRANFATAYLEYWDGAAWQTSGTWSSVIGSSLTAAVSGDWVTPNGGTIARYVRRGELVGGTLNRNGTLRRILANTEGVWGTDATTRRLEVQTDGVVTAGGTTSIQAPDGVLVVHGLTASRARWRVRIPSQSTAESYFEAGHIGIYSVAVPGAAFAWGWTDESRQNVSEARDRYGTAYRREEGPLQRIFAMAWTDGQAQGPLRTEGAAAAVSYVSVDGTNAVGVRRDVPWLLRGMLEEAAGGTLPVVGLANLTADVSSQMITDPSVWVVGYWTGSVATAHVSGILGDDEVTRVETVSIEALT